MGRLSAVGSGADWKRSSSTPLTGDPDRPLEFRTRKAATPDAPTSQEDPYAEIVGVSDPMLQVRRQIELAAPTDATVLITGETGTGKELVARAVHRRSERSRHPMVVVNCGALPSTLIESELFGHERGAFTGAIKRKVGRFEQADGGTVFLDEIGDLPLELQPKFLRVLQDGEFERIGSNSTQTTNVRVIAATNQDLGRAVEDGRFRADLFYRLQVVPVALQPLRRRREDIPLLVWHFIRHHQQHQGKAIRHIPQRVQEALVAYDWPGNVRELANVIERAIIFTHGDTLSIEECWSQITSQDCEPADGDKLDTVMRKHILDVLDRCKWRVKGPRNAAELLGLNPSTLRDRMKKLGIERPDG